MFLFSVLPMLSEEKYDGNSLSWSLVARSRVADRHTPREKTLWNHFNKHMEKHNNYFLLMFLKKHWEKMIHVFTMFFSWGRRSQDGFPTVLSSYWRKVKLRFYHFYPDVSQMICIRRMIYCMSTSVLWRLWTAFSTSYLRYFSFSAPDGLCRVLHAPERVA